MKIKVLFTVLCIFILTIIQSTVLEYVKISNIKPNLFVVFIISFALARGNVEGAAAGFFSGLSQDMVTGRILGFYSLWGLYLGLAAGSVNKRFYRENYLIAVFFTFILSIIYELAVFFFSVYIREQTGLLSALKGVILPEAVYNSLVSVFIYMFVMRYTYERKIIR